MRYDDAQDARLQRVGEKKTKMVGMVRLIR
jgi:hypothetical protein